MFCPVAGGAGVLRTKAITCSVAHVEQQGWHTGRCTAAALGIILLAPKGLPEALHLLTLLHTKNMMVVVVVSAQLLSHSRGYTRMASDEQRNNPLAAPAPPCL